MNEDGSMAKEMISLYLQKSIIYPLAKLKTSLLTDLKKENLIKLKKTSNINLEKQNFKIKIFENTIDGSEHFCFD